MSFNFGSNLGANTSQPGFAFGAPKTNAPSFGSNTPTFGALANPQTQPAGSITFGTPIASVAPTPQNAGLPFGTPTLGTGLAFGTPTSSAAPALNFGTPAKTTGLSFGTPTTQQTALNFGTPTAATQPSLSFGTPAPQTGLNFGAPATQPGVSFGTSTAATPGLNFGAPTPASNSGFTLGAVSTTANPLGGINFAGTTTTTSAGLNFAAPNTNPLGGINFATPGITTTTTGFTLGTSTPSTGLNFGLGGTTPNTLNFKTPTTSTTGGLFAFNTPKPQTTTNLTLNTATTPIGLGGVDSSQLKTGTVSTGRTDTVAAKENQVPNEILQSIESFKQFVKDQKSQSSDVSRGSARPFVKVKEDIDLINSILTDVGNDLQRNQQQADKLKHDSAKCLHNAEIAQRTNDTPPGLQFENNAPLRYFIELVNQFEQDLQALRVQIDVTDKHFQSLHEPKFLTSQELATGMRRLHDTFVALAGRLHSVHTQVESHKEQYLNLRKYILKDPTNIFMKPASKEDQALDVALRGLTANKTVSGPTPFSSFGSPYGMNLLQAQQNAVKPPPAYPSTTTSLNFGSGSSLAPQLGTSLFGTPSLGPQGVDSAFQLQNPPPGNKRGKR